VQDRIERSIDIAAPLDRVWELVSEPGWWVPDEHGAAGEPRPGAVVVRESKRWGRFPVEVVELRPMAYAAFRWASEFAGQELAPGRTTLVEFTITAHDDHVRVTVVESGFASLDTTEQTKRSGVESNASGWREELESLRDRALAAA
jgi:uncharacterized protein YndB with AHSA1/START domain